MTEFTLSVPCLFGLEGLCAQELRRLDMKEVAAENGRVLFKGTFEDIIRANLWLRTGERVLLRLASFPARTFEELFQGVYHTPLEAIIPKNGMEKASSRRGTLSVRRSWFWSDAMGKPP